MTELRCGACRYWLGESAEPLVFVETVTKSADAIVVPPRYMWLCKGCSRINVFIPRKELDASHRLAVRSA